MDIISSGPTYPDQSTPQDCLDIISSLNVYEDLPRSVTQYLKLKRNKRSEEHAFGHVHNVIVGSNQLALLECQKRAIQLGYCPVVLSSEVEGESRNVGRAVGTLCASLLHGNKQDIATVAGTLQCDKDTLVALLQDFRNPVCLIAGGETTVHVQHKGTGGRNQELALAASIALHENLQRNEFNRCVILSAGTDGQDGPTPAAGAYASAGVVEEALKDGLVPKHFLQQNDSYSFYHMVGHGEHCLVTGLTGTNVMDLQVALLDF